MPKRSTEGGGVGADIRWLVADQLGTPRIVLDKTGSFAATNRHDYLPFGEELFAETGGRTTGQGYTAVGNVAADGVRQQFTLKERDNETGLDYFLARYYSSKQGRFTGVDPLMASAQASLPQSWNRYSYSFNNPLAFIDPDGRKAVPNDYYADRDGAITIDETADTFDRFHVENPNATTPWLRPCKGITMGWFSFQTTARASQDTGQWTRAARFEAEKT